MKGYYKGKQPCAGCGRPGTEKRRIMIDRLCSDCQSVFDLGRAGNFEMPNDYVNASITWYSVRFVDLDDEYTLNGNQLFKAVTDLLKSLQNKHANTRGFFDITKREATTAKHHFKIREPHAQAIKTLVDIINEQQMRIREMVKGIEPRVEKEIRKCKADIYNEGVAAGKNLLIGLNDGSISIHDFDHHKNPYKDGNN